MTRKRKKSHYCANCGYNFRGYPELMNYCPVCGQENHNPRQPLFNYLSDFFENYFHIDNKTWKSLITLVFKPGTITKDFIENKRARYTPPVRMLILILAVFILTSLIATNQFIKMYSPKEYSNTYKEWIDKENSNTLYKYTIPFFWSKKESITIARLRQLEKIEPHDVGHWLDTSGYSSGLMHRLYFKRFQKLLISNLSFRVLNQESSKINYLIFLSLMPLSAFLTYLFFYRKGLLYYDCLILALHIWIFIMLITVLINLLIISVPQLFKGYLPYSTFVPLILSLPLNIMPALRKVFKFNWISTIARLIIPIVIIFLIYSYLEFLGYVLWV